MIYEITYLDQSNDFSFHFSKLLRKTCFETSQVRHDLNHLGFKIINFRVKIINLYHFGILINNFGQLCIQIILKVKNIEINNLQPRVRNSEVCYCQHKYFESADFWACLRPYSKGFKGAQLS